IRLGLAFAAVFFVVAVSTKSKYYLLLTYPLYLLLVARVLERAAGWLARVLTSRLGLIPPVAAPVTSAPSPQPPATLPWGHGDSGKGGLWGPVIPTAPWTSRPSASRHGLAPPSTGPRRSRAMRWPFRCAGSPRQSPTASPTSPLPWGPSIPTAPPSGSGGVNSPLACL